jgi:hypothetical protein
MDRADSLRQKAKRLLYQNAGTSESSPRPRRQYAAATRAAHALEACMQENTRGMCAPLKSAVYSCVSASLHLQVNHPLAFCHAPAQGRILLIKKVAPLAPHALNLPPAHANVPGRWRCAACLRHAELSLERMHLGANLLNLFGPAAVETRRE